METNLMRKSEVKKIFLNLKIGKAQIKNYKKIHFSNF